MTAVKLDFSEKFQVKDLGGLQYFLGRKVIQDHKNGSVWIGQESYTENILRKIGIEDAKTVKRIFRYLKGTQKNGFLYYRSDFNCVGFTDAYWGGDLDDRKSTCGWCFKLFEHLLVGRARSRHV